jgi:hypothetical protein
MDEPGVNGLTLDGFVNVIVAVVPEDVTFVILFPTLNIAIASLPIAL